MTMPGIDNGAALAGYQAGRDADLERDIDSVGREAVFAMAEKYGWRRGDMPPKFVWRGIVDALRYKRACGGAC